MPKKKIMDFRVRPMFTKKCYVIFTLYSDDETRQVIGHFCKKSNVADIDILKAKLGILTNKSVSCVVYGSEEIKNRSGVLIFSEDSVFDTVFGYVFACTNRTMQEGIMRQIGKIHSEVIYEKE